MRPLIGDIMRVVKGNALILSGLTDESATEIKKELNKRGWRIKRTLKDGEWRGFYAVRNTR
jgi:ribosomal protein L11 methylase PrmA